MLYMPYLLIIFVSVCDGLGQRNVSSEISTFNRVMVNAAQRLCSIANICGNNNLENDDSQSGMKKSSCCRDCSCDASCSKLGNCCFYTEAEKVALLNQRKNQECIAPLTTDLLTSEYYKYRFYYMTTSCPDQTDSGRNKTHKCGDVSVAPWGSLFPLYSNSTRKIYKNRACAECHGVSDGVEWLAYMKCKVIDRNNIRYRSVSENFIPLSENSVSEYCKIHFSFEQISETELCYPDIIDTCNETFTESSKLYEMTSQEIVEACINGIAAPMHFIHNYANVFCFLCNGGESSIAESCFSYKPFSDLFESPDNSKTFSCLLDGKSLKNIADINSRKYKRIPKACITHSAKNQEDDICTHVLCPSGQICDINFKCFYPALTMQNSYHLALRLKFDSELMNVSTLVNLLQSGNDVGSWMKSPWPNRWAIYAFYYELEMRTNQSMYIGSLILFLKLQQNGRKHSSVLKEVKFLMAKPWKIMTKQSEIYLFASFLEYNALFQLWQFNDQSVPEWFLLSYHYQYTGKIPSFQQDSIFPVLRLKEILPLSGKINKINFCKMISLGYNGSDYELILDSRLLFYNDAFYFDGEFDVIANIDGKLEPRICIEDSPFEESPLEVSSSTRITHRLFVFTALTSIYVIL